MKKIVNSFVLCLLCSSCFSQSLRESTLSQDLYGLIDAVSSNGTLFISNAGKIFQESDCEYEIIYESQNGMISSLTLDGQNLLFLDGNYSESMLVSLNIESGQVTVVNLPGLAPFYERDYIGMFLHFSHISGNAYLIAAKDPAEYKTRLFSIDFASGDIEDYFYGEIDVLDEYAGYGLIFREAKFQDAKLYFFDYRTHALSELVDYPDFDNAMMMPHEDEVLLFDSSAGRTSTITLLSIGGEIKAQTRSQFVNGRQINESQLLLVTEESYYRVLQIEEFYALFK